MTGLTLLFYILPKGIELNLKKKVVLWIEDDMLIRGGKEGGLVARKPVFHSFLLAWVAVM